MVLTIKKFFCLSLKTGSNIAGICGIIVCSIAVYGIVQDQNQKHEAIFRASCFTLLYALVSILLLIGVNKPDHKMMLPWMLLQSVITLFILFKTFVTHFMGLFLLSLYLTYSLLCVWSLYCKVKVDSLKNVADASIQFYSEPREFVLDTPQSYVFPVPQKYSSPEPLDDLPPSYDSVVGASALPPRA